MNLLYSFIISKILVYIFNSFFFDKPLKFNVSQPCQINFIFTVNRPILYISYCCLCQCQAVCYYYMPVPTKY
jgi:hypothetical protein